MFQKIVIGKIHFNNTLLHCSCRRRRCCFAYNSAMKSQLSSSASVLFWKPQTEVPFARSARLFLALKKLLVMLSVAIANATVQHLVKEEGDVATRAQRRLLPEEFRGGFTLDIPRRLKKKKKFMESFESHAFSPTVGRQVFPPYSQPSHRESIVSSGTAAGCWFSMSASWLTQDV